MVISSLRAVHVQAPGITVAEHVAIVPGQGKRGSDDESIYV